jgi:hypothetical protein
VPFAPSLPSSTVFGAPHRIMLPNGSKIDRKFLASGTIEAVRDFIDVHLGDNGIPIETYSLSTNYPKRTFENDSITLTDAGLHPQSVLYVQDLVRTGRRNLPPPPPPESTAAAAAAATNYIPAPRIQPQS